MLVTLIGGESHGVRVSMADCDLRHGAIFRRMKQRQAPHPAIGFRDAPISIDFDTENYRIEELRDGTGARCFVGVPACWDKLDLIDGACDAGVIQGDHLVLR